MKVDLPDHILKNINTAVKADGHVKGQPTLKERIRKALIYQDIRKKMEITAQ